MSESKTLWLSRGEGRLGEFWLWRVRPTLRGSDWGASSREALTHEVVTRLSEADVVTFCSHPPAPGECLPVGLVAGEASEYGQTAGVPRPGTSSSGQDTGQSRGCIPEGTGDAGSSPAEPPTPIVTPDTVEVRDTSVSHPSVAYCKHGSAPAKYAMCLECWREMPSYRDWLMGLVWCRECWKVHSDSTAQDTECSPDSWFSVLKGPPHIRDAPVPLPTAPAEVATTVERACGCPDTIDTKCPNARGGLVYCDCRCHLMEGEGE